MIDLRGRGGGGGVNIKKSLRIRTSLMKMN